MRDRVFQNQGTLDEESLRVLALSIELDRGEFDDCLAAKKHAGRILHGAQPIDVFREAIRSALQPPAPTEI